MSHFLRENHNWIIDKYRKFSGVFAFNIMRGRIMPDNCSKMGQNLSAYMDGALDSKSRAEVEAHIAGCACCAGELKFMAAVDADLKRLPVIEPSPFFAARVSAAARTLNGSRGSLRRFLRLPVPAMALMVSFLLVNILTFAFNINAMENGPRRELTRKVVAQLAKPASLINPVAVARLCAKDGAALRHDLVVLLAALGQLVPRLWLQ